MRSLRLLLAVSTLLPAFTSAAAPPEDLLTAMDVDLADCSNITSDGTDVQRAVLTDLGVVTHQTPPNMALLSTGDTANIASCTDVSIYTWGQGPNGEYLFDLVNLEMDCVVPPGAAAFGFRTYFFSREYPDYVGSVYNDSVQVHVDSQGFSGNVLFDANGNVVDVNSVLFIVTQQNLLLGTGFDCGNQGGGTDWLATLVPVTPGETIHLRFELYDVSDGIYDSAALLDGFYWDGVAPPSPLTGRPVEFAGVNPSTGDVDGGEEVIVLGGEFDPDTRVFFDDEEVTASYVNDERMKVITPAWDGPGPVAVKVHNGVSEFEIDDAFTYVEVGDDDSASDDDDDTQDDDTVEDDDVGDEVDPENTDDGGTDCSCRVAPGATPGAAAAAALVCALATIGVRRRARGRKE